MTTRFLMQRCGPAIRTAAGRCMRACSDDLQQPLHVGIFHILCLSFAFHLQLDITGGLPIRPYPDSHALPNVQSCLPVDCKWGKWSEWSARHPEHQQRQDIRSKLQVCFVFAMLLAEVETRLAPSALDRRQDIAGWSGPPLGSCLASSPRYFSP